MLPRYNRGESDLNGYTKFGRDGLCLVPSKAPGKLYPAAVFIID